MKNGLILEGGAMRSIFTAGVIDSLLDNAICFDEVYTVSAGAYAAMNYLSQQRGRCIETNVSTLASGEDYMGLKTFFRTGGYFFDMKKLFDIYPNIKFPFDYDKFYSSTTKLITGVTDCKTGKSVFYREYGNKERLMKIMQASNSLPFISKLVPIDGGDMVDGGMSDPIPVFEAINSGVEKPVVVLTQNKDYRKKPTSKYGTLIRMFYWRYPEFRKLLKNRPIRYNQVLDYLDKEEEKGNIFVIRPTLPSIKNAEKDISVLMEFYNHGYDSMKNRMSELIAFLGIK